MYKCILWIFCSALKVVSGAGRRRGWFEIQLSHLIARHPAHSHIEPRSDDDRDTKSNDRSVSDRAYFFPTPC